MDNGHHRRFWAAVCTVVLASIALLYFAASRPSTQEMHYDQFLAVMPTALGVMLAAVTLLVGLIAVFGYQFLRDEARKKAIDVAEEAVDSTMRATRDRAQATGLSVSQAEDIKGRYTLCRRKKWHQTGHK